MRKLKQLYSDTKPRHLGTSTLRHQKKLFIVAPRGWCAGVERAIKILETALSRFAPPIYVHREIVHNRTVVDEYKKRRVVFVKDIADVPPKSTVIFSAHGVAPGIYQEANRRNLRVIDATCPLVTKVHNEVLRYVKNGYKILYIGHRNHEEAAGVLGEAPASITVIEKDKEAAEVPIPEGKAVILTQTTLSADDTQRIIETLRGRIPQVQRPAKEDICYATTNRQRAVKTLISKHQPELIYVIGSANSSNSNRLCEVAKSMGVSTRLIDEVSDIQKNDWREKSVLGLTAGASAPESLIQEVADYFKKQQYTIEESVFEHEDVDFALPKNLTSSVSISEKS